MKRLLTLAVLASTSSFGAEYIVKLKQDAKINKTLASYGEFENLKLNLGNFYKLTSEQKEVMNSLANDPNVEYIEPNYTYSKFDTIQDTDFEKQWGLDNNGRNSGGIFTPGTKGIDISAKQAWTVTKGDSQIKIAVIDTGVDYNHVDLKANMMVNEAELNGDPNVDDDGNGFVDDIYGYDFANDDADPMDGHGHGTHCAGVIGAEHNSAGIRGVMGNVQILAIKFLTDQGSGSLDGALKAIDYATARGVNVMSNSWGGGGRSQALFEAIERAKNAGILFVAAAGNSNSDNDTKDNYPSNYKLDNVVAVGAHDGKGQRASFSNYGKKTVHIFAPGVNIYSTVAGDKYQKMSGTSMATPHVSGIAGLVWANEPNLTYTEVKSRMMNTSVRSGDLSNYTVSGYADAYNALSNSVK